jgi:hypothetical protein
MSDILAAAYMLYDLQTTSVRLSGISIVLARSAYLEALLRERDLVRAVYDLTSLNCDVDAYEYGLAVARAESLSRSIEVAEAELMECTANILTEMRAQIEEHRAALAK